KLPKNLVAIPSPVRQALRTQFHTLLYRARQRKSLRVFALGQRLRHFADHVAQSAGVANGERVRRWFQEKKTGWYAVLEDPQMPVTSILLYFTRPWMRLFSALVCAAETRGFASVAVSPLWRNPLWRLPQARASL